MIVGWGSSSMEGIGPSLESALRHSGRRFRNQGKSGETSHHTAARLGSLPPTLAFPGDVLPASGSVAVTSVLDHRPDFLKPVAGSVAGVAGVLAPRDGSVLFTREAPGESVAVRGGARFEALLGPELAGHDTLLWMGKNDLTHGASASEVIARTDATADWLADRGARILMLGHFVDTGSPADLQHEVEVTNRAHAERYGRAYLDVQGPLSSPELWSRVGLVPTDQDHAEQSAGRKPPSISSDDNHLDMVGYHLVAGLLRARLAELGWL